MHKYIKKKKYKLYICCCVKRSISCEKGKKHLLLFCHWRNFSTGYPLDLFKTCNLLDSCGEWFSSQCYSIGIFTNVKFKSLGLTKIQKRRLGFKSNEQVILYNYVLNLFSAGSLIFTIIKYHDTRTWELFHQNS